jgi:hypothetical protein
MQPNECQYQALLRRSGDTSLNQAMLLRNIQLNQNRSLPIMPPSVLLQRAQPIAHDKLRSAIQAMLDEFSVDLDRDLDEEFEALERSVLG